MMLFVPTVKFTPKLKCDQLTYAHFITLTFLLLALLVVKCMNACILKNVESF